MLRKTGRLFNVVTLLVAFVCGSVEVARAQSIAITDAAIQKAALDADLRLAASMQRRGRYARRPCDLKQRAKAGALIGLVGGMFIVNRIAADYETSAGLKATLAAGGYGAALGAWIGVSTCR